MVIAPRRRPNSAPHRIYQHAQVGNADHGKGLGKRLLHRRVCSDLLDAEGGATKHCRTTSWRTDLPASERRAGVEIVAWGRIPWVRRVYSAALLLLGRADIPNHAMKNHRINHLRFRIHPSNFRSRPMMLRNPNSSFRALSAGRKRHAAFRNPNERSEQPMVQGAKQVPIVALRPPDLILRRSSTLPSMPVLVAIAETLIRCCRKRFARSSAPITNLQCVVSNHIVARSRTLRIHQPEALTGSTRVATNRVPHCLFVVPKRSDNALARSSLRSYPSGEDDRCLTFWSKCIAR